MHCKVLPCTKVLVLCLIEPVQWCNTAWASMCKVLVFEHVVCLERCCPVKYGTSCQKHTLCLRACNVCVLYNRTCNNCCRCYIFKMRENTRTPRNEYCKRHAAETYFFIKCMHMFILIVRPQQTLPRQTVHMRPLFV